MHYVSSTTKDPVADVIGLLRPRKFVTAGLRATGPWAVRFEPFPHVKLGAMVRGECWLALDGQEPVLLRQGDIYLLGNPPSYVMGSALTVRPQAAKKLWGTCTDAVVEIGPAREDVDTVICGGNFAFDDPNAPILLDVLPRLVHLRAGDPRGRLLGHLCELLVAELRGNAVGSALVIDHLAQVMFVHMLRAHTEEAARSVGWLGALGDERVGAALRAMHADVAHRWTLEELASVAGMSRSAFAASFKRLVGSAPLEYLIHWRMSLARDALRHDTRSISDLAFATGYESESAFSTAFRRVVGSSPKQFRDRAFSSRAADERGPGGRPSGEA